ncbi:MAG: hypothetical protein WC829_01940 [Hyphomicrobium sp.]|jgi:hypothetical protein
MKLRKSYSNNGDYTIQDAVADCLQSEGGGEVERHRDELAHITEFLGDLTKMLADKGVLTERNVLDLLRYSFDIVQP